MRTFAIPASENRALQRYLRDLAALTALPAVWSGGGRRRIAEGMADVLVKVLALDFIYVRLKQATDEEAIEVARLNQEADSPVDKIPLDDVLALCRTGQTSDGSVLSLPHPLGNGLVEASIISIGYAGEFGVLVAASARPQFPTEQDRLLLSVVANQAAVVLQRLRAEEALRRSERELADFFDNATLGLHWVGPDGTILRVNQAELDLLGYRREEYLGRHIAEFHADPEVIGDILLRLQAGEELREYEARMRCKDGTIKHVVINSNVLRENGRFIHTRCFTRDITDRRRTEAALRESEQRFRLVAETIPSIVWTAAPDGALTYANERWFRYCGLTPGQNEQSWPELVLHPDDRERRGEAWTRAMREGTEYEIEVRLRGCDGSYRWFITRAIPLRDASERIVQWFGTTTDIDDRKRAEQSAHFLADASAALVELTDYESTLRKVADLAVPSFADCCAVDLLEADGTLRRLAVTHTGPGRVTRDGTLRRPGLAQTSGPRAVRKVVETCESAWAAEVPDALLSELALDEEEVRMLRERGVKSYLCVRIGCHTKVLGALTFLTAESGRVYDASDVRAAEDLADRVAIAIENARLLNALRESDRRKDEFLAMLAHELRNPLAPIRNAVQVLRAKSPPVPELKWAQSLIDRQVQQLTRLVDDLLDVSRITRGKIELRKECIELAAVVGSAVEASRPLIEKWGHELTVTIPTEPIYLEADSTRLSQILLNLLNNAAKYTEQGGHIWLTALREGDQVAIRVKDDGVGIPPEMLSPIFEMFMQVDRSLERSQGGLGIGLTLVQRLVEMHGGRVEALSAGAGKGSELVVRLPVAREVSGRDPQTIAGTSSLTAASSPRRILVVDDNKDAADSLAMLLRMMGHHVHLAYDGLEALGAVAAFAPKVVLLDIGLPKLNGYEVARRMRDQQGGRDIVLIALTGWGQDEDRRRSREAGFDHHLTKPVELRALHELLAALK